jgi:hypothetical protein
MGFADNLRNELKNENAEIIATRFEPRKDELMDILAKGIKRLGYVKIDVLCHTGTLEGDMLGVHSKEINAFADFIKAEGFRVSKSWWGCSSDGLPDMLTIRV